MSAPSLSRDPGADDAPPRTVLREAAHALASGHRHLLAEAIEIIATLPMVAEITLEVFPEREGARGLVVRYPKQEEPSPLPPRSGGVTQRFDMTDGPLVVGTLSITFREGQFPSPEVVAWCRVMADLMRIAVARYRMEALQADAQRFEVAGQIAAGLVHDFNNLLTGVMGYSAVARARMTPDHPAADALRSIEEVAVTAGEIARGLLNFMRGLDDVSDRVDPNEAVRQVRQLTAHAVRDAVAVQLDLAANLPELEGAATLIQQAVVNLVVNAADAITGPGEVIIRTRLVSELPDGLRTPPEPAAHYVAIAVTDSGSGIPPELLDRVFHPFFTTKGSRGSGLGLTLVARVAQRHGGTVHLASSVGQGSTFTIFLPVPESEGTQDMARSAEATAGG